MTFILTILISKRKKILYKLEKSFTNIRIKRLSWYRDEELGLLSDQELKVIFLNEISILKESENAFKNNEIRNFKKLIAEIDNKTFKNPYRYEKSTSNNNERIKILEKTKNNRRLFKVINYELLFISTLNIFTYLFAPFTFFQISGNLLLQNDILISFFSRFRGEPFILLVLICLIEWLIFIIYFSPSNVAWVRKHPNMELIFVLNICFGWTGIGCIILYIWATKSFNKFS